MIFLLPHIQAWVVEGRFVKDIKRRETPLYQVATCGARQITCWYVDVNNGDMVANPVHSPDKTKREFTILAFSRDYEYLYAGTTTGDVAVVLMKNRVIQNYIKANTPISSKENFCDGGGSVVVL